MTAFHLILITVIFLTGLVAGLFYGYDCSVIRGLGRLPDREFLTAFQSINRSILNPYFFISFLGSLLVLPLAAWISYTTASPIAFKYLLAASLLYVSGVFAVTVIGNVPLNNLLDQFDISTATASDIASIRQRFERKWNVLHHIRTYAAMATFLLSIISLLKK